ncbi:MAG: hypothetical protein V4773_15925, partial [Verrucomicrobiota bacterium]
MNPQNSLTPATPGAADPGSPVAQAKQSARDVAAKVKTAAADTVARAKTEAGRYAGEKKEAAAERLGGYSSSIHDTARGLEEKDPNIAWFTHQAADKVQGVADYLRDRDFDTLRADCESVARRHPVAFFGGLFVAGLVLGNMLKATSRTRSPAL